jgi:hypothetical protein
MDQSQKKLDSERPPDEEEIPAPSLDAIDEQKRIAVADHSGTLTSKTIEIAASPSKYSYPALMM